METEKPAIPGRALASRLKAAAIHLCVSILLATVLILLVTQVWYPAPLFDLARGRDIFLLLIGCDITLGPMLTLVIFNVAKPRKELVRDVSIIALVQLCAMVYGVSTLLKARPAYIVFNAGQFNGPLASDRVASDADGKEPRLYAKAAPWFGPKLMAVRLPQDTEARNRLLFWSVDGTGDIYQMPDLFVPYEALKSEVSSSARSPAAMASQLHLPASTLESAVSPFARPGVSVGLLPLVIRMTTALAVVDAKTGDFLGIVAVPEH